MPTSPYCHADFAKSISSIKSLPDRVEDRLSFFGIPACKGLLDPEETCVRNNRHFDYPVPDLKLQNADYFTQQAILKEEVVPDPKAFLKKARKPIPKNRIYAYNLTHSYVNGVKDQGARFVQWLNGKVTIDTKRSLNEDIQSKRHRFTEHDGLIVELPAKKPLKAKPSPATLMPPKQKRPLLKRNHSSEKNPFKQKAKRPKPSTFTLVQR